MPDFSMLIQARYSFCRAADDLIDDSASFEEAQSRVQVMRTFVGLAYGESRERLRQYANSAFPPDVRLAFLQLPVEILSKQPLIDLLNGFEMDLNFCNSKLQKQERWPIKTQDDLLKYGFFVAGTVAELCIDLVFHHHGKGLSAPKREEIKKAGVEMGQALQIVNISRDFQVDAAIERVYIPSDWLKAEGLQPQDVVSEPTAPVMGKLRLKLLDRAFALYEGARRGIQELPEAARGPMRVATESYMEIGRVLRMQGYLVQPGRATVGRWRRVRVAWQALRQ